MIDYLNIINKYYIPQTPLYELLIKHSSDVTNKALKIAKNCGEDVDLDFIYESAMLHDIGIFKTQAPSIYCGGNERYICHGVIGSELLQSEGLSKHALVCERHTGAGLSLKDIISQKLPLPHRDMLPISVEEKIICYADKFFSKSHLDREKSVDEIFREMEKYGIDTVNRFKDLHIRFGEK